LPIVLLALGLAGCLQMEARLELHPDGSGTVTERIYLSRRLLDLTKNAGPKLDLVSQVARAATLERMKHMGKGVALHSHEVREVDGGAREARIVFKIPRFIDLVYVSPFLRSRGYPCHTRIQPAIDLVVSDRWTGERGGDLVVFFHVRGNGRKSPPKPKKDAPKPPPPTPRELQMLRTLQPVFRDLMREFRLDVTFTCYSPLRSPELTGRRWHPAGRPIRLLYFDGDRSVDAHDYAFVDNEEVMLDVLRGALNSGTVLRHLRGAGTPIFHDRARCWFIASRPLYDQYVKGKKIRTTRWGKHAKDYYTGTVKFEQVGWKPVKK
jgi:hypothetical protein